MSTASDNTDRVMRDLLHVLNNMAKEPEPKRLTDVEKALRELIREQMRKMGVEHVSNTNGPQKSNYVASVAYAQSPTISHRYVGPLFFYYDLKGVVTCRITPKGDEGVSGKTFLEKLDIYTPDFVDNVAMIIDRHLPVANRSPHPHKLQLASKHWTPDVGLYPAKTGSIFQRFRLYLKRLIAFVQGKSNERFIWKHVIMRHFNPDEAELLEIEETFEALMQLTPEQTEQFTRDILKSRNKK